jgi:hypothetical protein
MVIASELETNNNSARIEHLGVYSSSSTYLSQASAVGIAIGYGREGKRIASFHVVQRVLEDSFLRGRAVGA